MRRLVALVALAGAVLGAFAPTAAAGDDATNNDPAQELAKRFAPLLMVAGQDFECDPNGERYGPASVEVVLDNPQIALRQVGNSDPVMTWAPSAADLFDLGEGFYLDFPGRSAQAGCIYERDLRRFSRDRAPVIYAHIATQDDEPGLLALQYWFFWYFNDWNNTHEGDWEGIQILFEASSVEKALTSDPISVGYAQHEGGERASWDADKLTRQGSRAVVFPSIGSHASYYEPSLFLGRGASEGFGCDDTSDADLVVDPDVVLLPDTVGDPTDPLAWLGFEGRWGERHPGAFNGPTGVTTKERWERPVDWHDGLRESSVTVPGGDGSAAQAIGVFCSTVEAGSQLLVAVKEEPLIVVIGLAVLVALMGFLLNRTDWSRVPPLPIVQRRRVGQMLRAGLTLYRAHPLLFIAVGLIYLPVAFLSALVVAGIAALPLIRDLVALEPGVGIVGALLTLVLGSMGYVVGTAIATAAVASMLREIEHVRPTRGITAFRHAAEHLRPLLGAMLRSVVIVSALILSVIGIPWAIRQIVRYTLLAPVVVLDDTTARGGMQRTSDLVRTRWFRTLAVIVLLNGLVLLVATVVGLLLLVILSGLPLWLFALLITLVAGLIVPYTSSVYVLLYGDSVAFESGDPPATDQTSVRAVSLSGTADVSPG